jgi:hypothetical protein
MRQVFADTYYFLALWNPDDEGHVKALAFTDDYQEAMVSTDWVMVELADALARPPNRSKFMVLYRLLQTKTDLTIVPLSRSLLEQGLALYEQRVDKEWSLTDCISFIVMKQASITEALTGDRHFEQAGFTALLK